MVNFSSSVEPAPMPVAITQSSCVSVFQSLLGMNVSKGNVAVQNETAQTTSENSWNSLLHLHVELDVPDASEASGPPSLAGSSVTSTSDTGGSNNLPVLTSVPSNRLNSSLTQVCAAPSTPIDGAPSTGVPIHHVTSTNAPVLLPNITLPVVDLTKGSTPGYGLTTTATPAGTSAPVDPQSVAQLPPVIGRPTPPPPLSDTTAKALPLRPAAILHPASLMNVTDGRCNGRTNG